MCFTTGCHEKERNASCARRLLSTATEHEYARTEHAVMYVQSEVADFEVVVVGIF